MSLLCLTCSVLFQVASPSARPVPLPSPAPSIEGTVKGPNGKPIADALVMARSLQMGDVTVGTRTDASGRFQLTLRRPLTQVVRVEAQGFAGRTIDKVAAGAKLDVSLTKGMALEGTVRDGTTGQPASQAVVAAQTEFAMTLPWEPSAGVTAATTDAKGHFRLEGLSEGPQTIRAHARNIGAGRSRAIPGHPLEIYLFPSATIGGTVSGPANLPIRGAVVRAEKAGPRPGNAPLAVETDAQGRYEITGLDPGIFQIVARHPGFAPGVAASTAVERGSDLRLNVVLEKGVAVVGRLVTGVEERVAVAGRVAVQEIAGEGAPPSVRQATQVEAGPDGRFRVERMPSGSHALAVTSPGYISRRVEVLVGTRSNEVDLGDVELESGLTIRGRVRDRARQPVVGASVVGAAARPMPSRRAQAVTEADGAFVLAGMEPGPQRLSVSASGYVPATREAEAGATGVEIVVSPGGNIAGMVVDQAGREVESFQISAEPAKEDTPMGMMLSTPRSRNVTSADGRFTVEDLVEGTYVVTASAADHAGAHVSGIKVVAGSTTDVGKIRLTAGGTVRGTVVDSASAPVPGAVVSTRGPGAEQFMTNAANQAVTDPSGAFELRGVAPGTVEMTASHPSYAEGRVGGVEVDIAKGPAEVRIVLAQGGRLEGSVRRRDGSPIGGAYVSVLPQRPGGGYLHSDEPSLLTTTAEGAFVAEHLPPGAVNVVLMTKAGSLFTSAQMKDVVVREGETTPVELRSRDILISGHVTRAGAPLAGARLSLRGGRMMFMSFAGPAAEEVPAVTSGPSRMSAVTGEDGGYEMIAEEPGQKRLMTESADGRVSYPARSVDVPDADMFTLDLAFTTATLPGVVLDRDTQKPIARAQVSASPKGPRQTGGSSARTGDDGRFQLELDSGDYRVRASADDYGSAEADTSVGTGGGNEVTLTLGRGLSLSGRVVDSRGRGIGGLPVMARGEGSGGYATTRQDGTFSMAGLTAGRYGLSARSEQGAFAVAAGVKAGDKDVVLTLRPGGRVTVRVLGLDGQPVEGAQVFAFEVASLATTGAAGTADLAVPAGKTNLHVSKERLDADATVEVGEGGAVAMDIKLESPAPGAGPP